MGHALDTSTAGSVPLWPECQPWDEYNRKWLSLVRPADWQNPAPARRYNLVVIGGGPAGLVAAAGAAGLGAKVALVERRLLGGDCLNVGCVPSKALLRSATAARHVRYAEQFGVTVPDMRIDFPQLMERLRRLRAELSDHDSVARFQSLGVDVFLGEARFSGPDTVEVAGQTLHFLRACIATGSRPSLPPIPGLADVNYLTNETVFSLTQLPKRVGILGAGAIGCELAQAFACFGSDVVLLEAAHGVLPNEDPAAAAIIQQSLQRDGVHLICGAQPLNVTTQGDQILMHVVAHGQTMHIGVDHLIVATGRVANVDGLQLEAAGVEWDATGVKVNDYLQTTNRRVYAAGDVCSGHKYTHAAEAMARLVIQNALLGRRQRVSRLLIPRCVYTYPELASVGLATSCLADPSLCDVVCVDVDQLDRVRLDGESSGLLKLHLRKGTDKIVAATLVADRAGDLIAPAIIAMTLNIGLQKLWKVIYPYPTRGEIWKKACDVYYRRKLTPRIQWLLRTLFAWKRR